MPNSFTLSFPAAVYGAMTESPIGMVHLSYFDIVPAEGDFVRLTCEDDDRWALVRVSGIGAIIEKVQTGE